MARALVQQHSCLWSRPLKRDHCDFVRSSSAGRRPRRRATRAPAPRPRPAEPPDLRTGHTARCGGWWSWWCARPHVRRVRWCGAASDE